MVLDKEKIFKLLNKDFNVSRETFMKLEKYAFLLEEKNNFFNLVGKNTIENLWERHVLDAVQLKNYVADDKTIIDFGSGAGIPSLILSICGYKVVSVESIRKKIDFQQHVKNALGLDVELINDRIENIKNRKNSIIMARAVAPLEKLFKLSSHLIIGDNEALFMKGRNFAEEIKIAEKKWNFKIKSYKSKTSKDSVILSIKELKWKL
jgi:16S rRNA (guanine527-N7)-methyltransferase